MPLAIGRGGRRSWQDTAADKLDSISSRIPKAWALDNGLVEEAKGKRKLVGDFFDNLLDAETKSITSMDNVDIVRAIADQSLSSVQVTTAYCKRAVYGHQISNILLDFDCDAALQRAKELDDYQAEHGKLVGPLHGLPVSMKDQLHAKGFETTMGYVGWVGTFEGCRGTGKEGHFDSELVRQLRTLGAIPFAKTTLVQSLWAGETNNNILGYLRNPHNQALTAGGSSGGEGALGAFRGSAFGLGTDSGGSISMPAAYNGLFSIKPSSGRLSFKGIPTSSPGQDIIRTVVGVVAPSIRSLKLVMKSIASTQSWRYDNTVLELPWKDDLGLDSTSKVALGLFENDGIVTPHPPMARALRIASAAVQNAGHKILQWRPPAHARSGEIHPTISRGDGMPDVVENINLSGEPFVPEIAKMFPNGKARPSISLLDFENATLSLKNFRSDYHKYWESTAEHTGTGRPVDAVLFPAGPHTAPLPGKSYWFTYTSVLNALDYCAVVIPVTTADAKQDPFDKSYKPVSEKDKLNWEAYDPETFQGAPVGIVIVGRQLQEEKLLAVAQIVYDALQGYKKQ